MFKTRKGLLLIILLFLFAGYGSGLSDIQKLFSPREPITVSERARIHILQGDTRGGGHQFAAGKPCKSEFPASWNANEIIEEVEKIAANDSINWRRQKNGYYVAEQTVEDGTRVRVVLNARRDDVVTAYPVNVARNPCPMRVPANDNFNE
ncbi:MAG: RhsD protein [Micavibrio aeruginosavorus]|uniref:RhsD protein n=1 Tax=Micavibrio aeruginosavorus TaxID=349221 RepID=A0A2W4ZKT3_9BACT|nr:MAG: RhsD protein [Micavibrio aeruginosavorus]